MPFMMSTRALARLDQAALRAAGQRSKEGRPSRSGGAAAPHAVFATAAYARTMLRHVLHLRQWVTVISQADDLHPLIEGAVSPAIRLQIPAGTVSRDFLAAYDSARRLTLSPIAPCPQCGAHVPRVCINNLADYGDWLRGAQDLAESPLYRTSPAHHGDCPLPVSH
ncbi:hypothetical protein ABZ599_16370 [Streptomyces misionensis]|uniref:hypothetical protein n=1 Tax=Streptomyces misionensis TaxID=67331 RepID=UPI0033E400A4